MNTLAQLRLPAETKQQLATREKSKHFSQNLSLVLRRLILRIDAQ